MTTTVADKAEQGSTTKVITKALEEEEASFDELMAKPRRVARFKVSLPGPDGDPVSKTIRYLALDDTAFDALVAAHPPTAKQAKDGSTWNLDTFPPALIAAVSSKPKMTLEQAKALYANEAWSPGEKRQLFFEALDVCAQGLNVPFSDGG